MAAAFHAMICPMSGLGGGVAGGGVGAGVGELPLELLILGPERRDPLFQVSLCFEEPPVGLAERTGFRLERLEFVLRFLEGLVLEFEGGLKPHLLGRPTAGCQRHQRGAADRERNASGAEVVSPEGSDGEDTHGTGAIIAGRP